MKRLGCLAVVLLALVGLAGAGFLFVPYANPSNLEEDTPYVVPSGATLTSVAQDMEERGYIDDAGGMLWRAKILDNGARIQAGEFLLPGGASFSAIVDILESDDVIRRFVTIPEGLPSIMVHERLMAEDLLTGEIPVPKEGSVLPDTYDFERGETRAEVLVRMQAAMQNYLAEAWPKRTDDIAVDNIGDAVVLASIVEKETGVARERRMVAGLYSNRVKDGMLLQADPTIIYPITRGKPLGRRIRQSEIAAINDYNTYTMVGLPKGPITNPGRESIAAVLNPAETDARYMVADGTGGHAFAETLDEHNRNVAKWFEIRRERGEM